MLILFYARETNLENNFYFLTFYFVLFLQVPKGMIYLFFLMYVPYLVLLKVASWLCTQESLSWAREPYGTPEIKPTLVVCKAIILPAVLWLIFH